MSEMYKAYEEYAKTLRTWFVAFGVGAPVLLMTNEALAKRIAAAPGLRQLLAAYCLGVAAQVIVAVLNKHIMWACYYGEIDSDFKSTCMCAVAEKLSSQYWIDAVADTITAALFAAATYRVFSILFP